MTDTYDNTPSEASGRSRRARERRFGARCRAFKKTQVILPDQDSVFDAVMRNLSRTGARLELPDVLHIPCEFRMRLVNEDIERDCKVIWRKPGAMGVVFLG